jgi:hypothetical protein
VHRAEIVAGAVFAALSLIAIFVLIPGYVPHKAEFGPTPAFFPTVSAVLIGLCGVGMVLHRLLRGPQRQAADAPSPISRANLIFLLVVGTVFVLTLAAMVWVGFIPAGIGLVAALMLYMGNRRWLVIAATAVLTPFFLYAVFTWGFGIPLP